MEFTADLPAGGPNGDSFSKTITKARSPPTW